MKLGNAYGMDHEPHGGGCCGVTHLYTFPSVAATYDERQEWLKTAVNDLLDSEYSEKFKECDGGMTCDCCDCGCNIKCNHASRDEWKAAVEVVLASYQMREWETPLLDFGFKEVFSFYNSNSTNRCHIFYLETGNKS